MHWENVVSVVVLVLALEVVMVVGRTVAVAHYHHQ